VVVVADELANTAASFDEDSVVELVDGVETVLLASAADSRHGRLGSTL
jgi:hypothetical protein